MARIHRVLLPILLLSALYGIAWLYIDDLPDLGSAKPVHYLTIIPFLAIASLGAYCVVELVWGVVTMGNAEQAYEELQRDIAAAKQDLKSKGIHVD